MLAGMMGIRLRCWRWGSICRRRGGFRGRCGWCFQPAEEGGRGAHRMMEDGLLERYPFDEIYGWHNYPYASAGGVFDLSRDT